MSMQFVLLNLISNRFLIRKLYDRIFEVLKFPFHCYTHIIHPLNKEGKDISQNFLNYPMFFLIIMNFFVE